MCEHACVPWAGGTHPGGREVRAAAPEESTGRHPSPQVFVPHVRKSFIVCILIQEYGFLRIPVWFPKNTFTCGELLTRCVSSSPGEPSSRGQGRRLSGSHI